MRFAGLMGNGPNPILSEWSWDRKCMSRVCIHVLYIHVCIYTCIYNVYTLAIYMCCQSQNKPLQVSAGKKQKARRLSVLSKDGEGEGGELGSRVKPVGFWGPCFLHGKAEQWRSSAVKAGGQLCELRPAEHATCPSLHFLIRKVAIISSFSEVNSGWRWAWGYTVKMLISKSCPILCDPCPFSAVPWTAACQVPLSIEFCRQE